MSVSDKIKKLREGNGLTQSELAKLSGVHLNTISGIELGRVVPNNNTLLRIAEALGTSGVDLLNSEEASVTTRLTIQVDLPVTINGNLRLKIIRAVRAFSDSIIDIATHGYSESVNNSCGDLNKDKNSNT